MKRRLQFVLIHFVSALLLFVLPSNTAAQTAGCTDPQALNFNTAATINNGSCTYPLTFHNPPFAFELSTIVNESSGLLFFNGKLWTFNDSGGAATLYAIDTVSGQIVQQISISNASNVDWEDISMDNTHIFIGDFGNNNGTRTDLVVYKILKSQIPASGNSSVTAERIQFSYSDQTSFEKSKTHNFDCEAMISAGENLFLFSKNRGDLRCKLYQIPKTSGQHKAILLDNFNSNGLVTGADFNQASNEVVLTGYSQNTYIPFLWILFDFDGKDFFGGNKRRLELVNLTTTQIEGVTYVSGKRAMISAENTSTFSARVFRFNSAAWTLGPSWDIDLPSNAKNKFIVLENPVQNNILRLRWVKPLQGEVRMDITDSTGRGVKQQIIPLENHSNNTIEIDVSDITSGIYNITFFVNRRQYSARFIQP